MEINEKIQYIKSLGYTDNEILIKHSLLRTEEIILNYLNLNKLPKGSEYTHIDMAILHLQQQISMLPKANDEGSNVSGKLSSIQEGDTTVKMAKASELETSTDKEKSKRIFEDKLLNDFKASLHKFRRMRW